MKQVVWLGDSWYRLKAFPDPVQDFLGHALYEAQVGRKNDRAKPLHGLGSGVFEIAANDASGTYRAVYTVSIGSAVYVLHAFQKKSKSGISTPQAEIEVVRQRLFAVA